MGWFNVFNLGFAILLVIAALSLAGDTASGAPPATDTLEQRLLAEPPADLAKAARKLGNPTRGALVFYQPGLACAKCHVGDGARPTLGPDLAKQDERPSDELLVESILSPSKTIRKGFEVVTIVTGDGVTLTGLLVEEGRDSIVIRDAARNGEPVTVAKHDIDQRAKGALSLMPGGLVNQLADRAQFLDLVRYLMEVAEGGPVRARELRPAAALLVPPPLPEYEARIDHAGLIGELDRESFSRGEAIYLRLCVNCHGTHDRPGSLPTSLRFATGKFKNGGDPYAIYQTLTKGFGQMTPQTWMVPRQKYDVIHYLREAYLKEHNPTQFTRVDRDYLVKLPRGDSRGPEPSLVEPWVQMDYGPSLINTYEVGDDGSNFAYKGIAVRLDAGPGGVSQGRHWMVFDHDTMRVAAAWSGEHFIDFNGIQFNGRHEVHPRVVGQVQFVNPIGPGWANPADGRFDDPRPPGRDDRPYGPLPRNWARYQGLYHFGPQTIIAYTLGDVAVLESPGLAAGPTPLPVFTRTFNLGPRATELVLQVAHQPASKRATIESAGVASGSAVVFAPTVQTNGTEPAAELAFDGATCVEPALVAGVTPLPPGAEWLSTDSGNLRLKLPAGDRPLRFTLWITGTGLTNGPTFDAAAVASAVAIDNPEKDLAPCTHGGPSRWPATLAMQGQLGADDGPFAVDVLTHPVENPWFCQMRFTGLDFLADGRQAAVCSWDGDVWLVAGIDRPELGLTWRRIASGLFQPLGLKVVEGRIFVTCRDQLVVLNDLNGDGETDFYENFNSDHQVTEHFHEFAMGLQTDAAGNFYYAKSARHGKTALLPHHGTLLRVSRDGGRTDIVATGFRAANGVCLNSDGSFFVTDQEGFWNPQNRINRVVEGGFYGNMWGYHDVTDESDSAMRPPVCWIANSFDRSPAELLWVPEGDWGPLAGALLNLSYGYGKIFVVPHESAGRHAQGGMCQLPVPQFPTGIMRGRFHPTDRQLYACGMFAWAGNQQQPGGLYRVRYTGRPVHVPLRLRARREGIEIVFSGRLDPQTAADAANYRVKTWSLKRTANYGSEHYDEKPLKVSRSKVSPDARGVFIKLPEIVPTWCMEIAYSLKSAEGTAIEGVIHNTIHELAQ